MVATEALARLVGTDDHVPTFPLLAYDDSSFATKQNVDELGIAWTSLIESGWFEGLTLHDVLGRTFRVTAVEKIRGVGRFWGWNLLYGRRLALEVHTQLQNPQHPFAKVRRDILGLLTRRGEWRSRDDYDSLVMSVENAGSIDQLIDALSRHGI